jgi:uncharacterized alkaline shock family protein YloU
VADQATIATDILARYAADAAREVEGVHRVVDRPIPGRRGVRVAGTDGAVRVEIHVVAEWGASIPRLGAAVQERVRAYLGSMADVELANVDVVVDAVEQP